jgi:membrane-bound metal-dependent hydrolase YbcI (DUF457 family)
VEMDHPPLGSAGTQAQIYIAGHRTYLHTIIEASAVPIHIWKVKSHIYRNRRQCMKQQWLGVANGTLYECERSEDNNDQHDRYNI